MKKSYVLPVALLLGLLLHSFCARLSVVVPYLIFTILLLNFTAVDLRKLRLQRLHLWLMLFQAVVSIGSFALLHLLGAHPIICQGVLVGVLCPVAASVVVISCTLGADRGCTTAYTIFGNLLVVVLAPLYFTLLSTTAADAPAQQGFWTIFCSIAARVFRIIGLPFFVALLLQVLAPKASAFVSRYKGVAFYLWACALLLTLGQTINFIFLHGKGHASIILWLGAAALLFCIVQFGLGKLIGRHYGQTIAGGQLLGQKNTAMGIWMSNTYLLPLASVFLAFYSIFQNLFNSYQIYRFEQKKAKS